MRQGKHFAQLAAALALGGALAAAPGGAQAAESAPLRVCADPDNLPFSSSAPGTPGLYVEFGQQIARVLGRTFEPVWSLSYFGKRTVRATLLAGSCDAYVGLPDDKGFMGSQVVFSKPFLHEGYALVVPPDLHISRLDDLKGKRVAVQFSTPPQIALASRDDLGGVGVTFLNPEDAMQALARHEVDAAFVWGPTAGYFNVTTLHGAYRVIPVAGEGLQWAISIGFAKAKANLRDEVDRSLDESGGTIGALEAKYGFPTAAPITLGSGDGGSAKLVQVADTDIAPQPAGVSAPPSVAAAPTASKDSPAPAPSSDADKVAAGQEAFNGTCAHCHGTDAVQSERRINLRLLQHKYGDKMDETFTYTVTHGRVEKGMPNWTDIISDDDFSKILAFLHTVQTK